MYLVQYMKGEKSIVLYERREKKEKKGIGNERKRRRGERKRKGGKDENMPETR